MKWEDLEQIGDEVRQISKIYEIFDEDARLRSPAGRVEFLTTVHYIEKYLQPGSRILDVGAGTGAYSFYFAEQGYHVDALELADENLRVFQEKLERRTAELAIEAAAKNPWKDMTLIQCKNDALLNHQNVNESGDLKLTLRQGNAMDLSAYKDASYDIVLLFGPLYHLHKAEDRQQCITEAKRVCKSDGMIFFAFINNDMVVLTEMDYDPHWLGGDTYDHDTFKVTDFPFVFLTVDQCRQTLVDGGIHVVHEVASDGVSELMTDRINGLSEEAYQQYLRYHFYCCEKTEMLGHSNHLLFVGCKV